MEEYIKHIEYLLDLYKENDNFVGRYISGSLFEKDFITIEHLLKAYKEDEAVIEEIAEYLSIVRDCPNEDKGVNLDCENRCSNDDNLYAECWKQYFRKKVKNEL